MKIYTGTDIIEVERIRSAIEGTRGFRDRVFTAAEQAYCDSRGVGRYESYAARFAAKEAAAKALGCGIGGQCGFLDCEIVRVDQKGAPLLRLTGEARKRLEALGITDWSVSLSHTGAIASATVTMIGKD